MHKGAAALLWGEPAARCVPALFAGSRRALRRGGNPPAPAFPRRGKRERGRFFAPEWWSRQMCVKRFAWLVYFAQARTTRRTLAETFHRRPAARRPMLSAPGSPYQKRG